MHELPVKMKAITDRHPFKRTQILSGSRKSEDT